MEWINVRYGWPAVGVGFAVAFAGGMSFQNINALNTIPCSPKVCQR